MGECILIKSGTGGTGSDECTASRDKVLSGYAAVTSDSNDEAILGTMPTYGAQTITPALNSQTVSSGGKYMTGNVTVNAIPNQRGSAVKGVGCGINSSGLYYHIPQGYYQEGSNNPWVYMTVTEAANAIGIQSIVNFKVAQYSNLTLIATWALPSRGPWSGIRVMCKQGSYPTSISDGILFCEGSGMSAKVTLATGNWYFRAWNYISTTTLGRLYGGYVDTTCNNIEIKGQQAFTSSGTFTVPSGVYQILAFCGGGGGGGGQNDSNCSGGSGGGYTSTGTYNVNPGQQLAINIGAGGSNGYNGSTTSISGLISAGGGQGCSFPGGGAGGSGGGMRGVSAVQSRWPGDGGSDGSNGMGVGNVLGGGGGGGTGQGRTTRAFGESGNTLYSGGGGGGNSDKYTVGGGGAGGGGVGAGYNYNLPGNGAFGTGGGGGGCYYRSSGSTIWQSTTGGSGICIIRWGY